MVIVFFKTIIPGNRVKYNYLCLRLCVGQKGTLGLFIYLVGVVFDSSCKACVLFFLSSSIMNTIETN